MQTYLASNETIQIVHVQTSLTVRMRRDYPTVMATTACDSFFLSGHDAPFSTDKNAATRVLNSQRVFKQFSKIMGKGNRGFKPQGMPNPILMARLSRPIQTESTTRHRLDRESRPSWEEVKKVADKKEKSTSDFLEQWENDNYREELKIIREGKRRNQQRHYLKQLGKLRHSYKKRKKRKHDEESSETSNNDSEISDSSSLSKSDCNKSNIKKHTSKSKRSHKSSHRKASCKDLMGHSREMSDEKHKPLNPFKFSNLLHIKTPFD